jgi:hypothetical protein
VLDNVSLVRFHVLIVGSMKMEYLLGCCTMQLSKLTDVLEVHAASVFRSDYFRQ